jgi:hypothetical protein
MKGEATLLEPADGPAELPADEAEAVAVVVVWASLFAARRSSAKDPPRPRPRGGLPRVDEPRGGR